MNVRLATVMVGAILLCLGTGCAAVDTAGQPATAWPEAPVQPWERLDAPGGPGPEGWDEGMSPGRNDGTSVGIFDLGYRFYVRGLTQIDGARCEHRPTCARYAHDAVVRRGFVFGVFLGIDRLMRSDRSSALRRLPTYDVRQGAILYDDPVEENDFFL